MRRSAVLMVVLTTLLGLIAMIGPAAAKAPGPMGRLLYVVITPRCSDCHFTTMDPDGTDPDHVPGIQFGRWSPDGSRLATFAFLPVFAIRALAPSGSSVPSTPSPPAGRVLVGAWDPRTDTAHWYTVGTDGSGKTDLGIDATCSVWFPDGRRILITDDASGFPLRPAILSPEGSLIARLDATRDPGLNLGCGDVSPDGSRLVLEGFKNADAADRNGIYSVSAADGGDLRRLTRGSDGYPRYSPDGSEVVFLRTKSGTQPEGAGALFVVGVDGSGLRRITPWGAASLQQDWSPDGEWIAFQHPYGELFVVHPDGTGLHRIPLELPAGAGARQPTWSPDWDWIIFSVHQDRAATIYVVHPDGTGLQQVTASNGEEQMMPDWTSST